MGASVLRSSAAAKDESLQVFVENACRRNYRLRSKECQPKTALGASQTSGIDCVPARCHAARSEASRRAIGQRGQRFGRRPRPAPRGKSFDVGSTFV